MRLLTRTAAVYFLPLTALFFSASRPAAACNPIEFLNARERVMYGNGIIYMPMVRQLDGSYTLYGYSYSPPYPLKSTTPNAQTLFTDCLPAPRTRTTPQPLVGRRPGDPSGDSVIFANSGDGLPSGAWVAFNGQAVQAVQVDGAYGYKTRLDYTVGERTGLLPGDFNGDGKPDIAVLGYTAPTVSDGFVAILAGKGDGSYEQAVKTATGGNYPNSMTVADFNGDGKLDLALVQSVDSNGSASALVLMLGKGDGTFQAPTQLRTGSGFNSVNSADWNGDGRPDLAVTSYVGPVQIMLNTGNGAFGPPLATTGGPNPRWTSSGDFNKDGKLDIAVSGSLGVMVRPGNGDGTFGAGSSYVLGHDPQSIVVVDLNSDGNLDIVAGEGIGEGLVPVVDTGAMAVLMGNGDGTFIGAPLYFTGASATDIGVADLNRDGKLDLITAQSNGASLLLGQGANEFATPQPLAGSRAVATGDFNGDGFIDVALNSAGNNGITGGVILYGNGDGTFRAPVTFPTRAGITGFTTGDFNGDGRTDLAATYGGSTNGTPAGVAVVVLTTTLQTTDIPTGIYPVALTARDFNGDGRIDLAVVDEGVFDGTTAKPGALFILNGRGNGTFDTPISLPAGTNPQSIAAGDLNGDGRPDLVLTTFAEQIVIFQSSAIGLGAAKFMSTDFGPQSTAIADFNGDGKMDLIVAHCCGDTDMTYSLGHGDGTFDAEAHFSGGASPKKVMATDLDGDGRPDLILLNSASASQDGVAIFLNITPKASTFQIVSPATFRPNAPVSPDSIATAFGAALAATSEAAAGQPLPLTLGGARAKVRDSAGTERDAGLYYASPGQVNLVIPAGTATGAATVTITSASTQTASVQVAKVAPELLVAAGTKIARGFIVHGDFGQVAYEDVLDVSSTGAFIHRPIVFKTATENLALELYGTGFRLQSNTTASIGGVSVPVLYAGPHSLYAGLDQLNLQVPRSLQGRGVVDLVLSFDGVAANAIQLEFR